MWTAPVITSRGGGTCTVRKTLPCGVSSTPLLPLRTCFSSRSFSGSRAISAPLTRRCSPLATSVTTIAARRAARSVLSALRMSSFTAWCPASEVRHTSPHPFARTSEAKGHQLLYDSSAAFRFEVPNRVCRECCRNFKSAALVHLLHINSDGAAAGEPNLPGGLVGDAEFQRLGLAALDHIERLGDDRALDATARHRAEEVAVLIDDEIRADRTRRRAPGLDHGRERDAAPRLAPVLGGLEDVFIAGECFHAFSLRRLRDP